MAQDTSLKKLKARITPVPLVSLNTIQNHLGLTKAQILAAILITAPQTTFFSAPYTTPSRPEELFFSRTTAKELFNLDI